MPNVDHEKKLAEILDAYRQSGLFTEAFAATGSLKESSPRFCFGDPKRIFDISSVTKMFAMTSLVFRFLDEKNHDTSLSIGEWIDQHVKDQSIAIALQHLRDLRLSEILAHQSGLPAWRNFYVSCVDHANQAIHSKERILEVLTRTTFDPARRGKDCYSDLGPIMLGLLLEESLGKTIDQQFADLLQSLNLKGIACGYAVQLDAYSDKEFVSTGKPLRQVHDENCAALGGVTTHAGLFASGEAACKFIHAMYISKLGKDVLAKNFAAMRENSSSLLGLRKGDDEGIAAFAGGKSMGHWGFTGTGVWIDVRTETYALLFTNRVISSRMPPPEMKLCRKQSFSELNAIISA